EDSLAEQAEQIAALLQHATAIVVGPGLGRSTWSRQLLQQVLQAGSGRTDQQPVLVMDADALNLLAESRGNIRRRDHWILTPHPGEAARLLGCDAATVQSDR